MCASCSRLAIYVSSSFLTSNRSTEDAPYKLLYFSQALVIQ